MKENILERVYSVISQGENPWDKPHNLCRSCNSSNEERKRKRKKKNKKKMKKWKGLCER